jgi:glycerate kinase
MSATSFGTGELIRNALDRGAREILVGVGGSATVDGGIGMAQALGFRLLTAYGRGCGPGGAALPTLEIIDTAGVVPTLAACRIRVACDVTNPLLGPRGAARIFGPQKGATPRMVDELELGLSHLARVWRREGLLDAVDHPGDGAAGGLGAGLRAFCRAELVPGAELIAAITGFDDEIRDADLLITGEGSTDEQTADGKLPAVLAAKARAAGARSILISGSIQGDVGVLGGLFDGMVAARRETDSLDQAIRCGRERLAEAARTVARSMAEA